jgi:hypothetical protein
LQDKMRRIILFDHHDWIRLLGNALSRAMGDERVRKMLFERLA